MSSSESFYWHDYETSGAEVFHDRPMQFAGLRTDLDLNIVGEPLVIYAKPSPDFLPHPAAVRITSITPQHAQAQGLRESEFMAQIHAELAQAKTCSIGYNSIRFDDEITRFALWRNFFDAYEREYANGNSRWDLIDVVRAVYALRPTGTVWPVREDGQPSFRLEALTAANGIEHGAAHDALSDVTATIDLARHLRKAQPALFDALFALRTKKAIQPLLDVSKMRPVIHVSGMFGAARSHLALVVPLALHPKNGNEVICADLSQAPDFLDMSPELVRSRLFAKSGELPEGVTRPALKTIRINRAPVILPSEWVAGEPAERLQLDGEAHRRHLTILRAARDNNPEQFGALIQGFYVERVFEKRSDPDSMLYDGFIPPQDKALFNGIRAASGEQLGSQRWSFRDPRLPELLFRYRARNYPETLTPAEQAQWREHCQSRYHDADSPFNLAQFQQEMAVERGQANLSVLQINALDALDDYVRKLSVN